MNTVTTPHCKRQFKQAGWRILETMTDLGLWLRNLSCLALLLALAGCANLPVTDFDEPEIRLVSLRPLSVENMEARFEIRLRVINPNAVAINIDGLYSEVFLRDQRVLSGTSAGESSIPAYGEGDVVVNAGIGMLDSLALIRTLSEKPPTNGLPYMLKTKLSVKGIPYALRLEHEGNIAAP